MKTIILLFITLAFFLAGFDFSHALTIQNSSKVYETPKIEQIRKEKRKRVPTCRHCYIFKATA
jgi:hypothetical protein